MMAEVITIHIQGLAELGAKMRLLTAKVNKQIAGRATNAAAQVIKRQTKTNIVTAGLVDTGAELNAVIVKKMPASQTALTSEHIVTIRGRGKTSKKTGRTQASAPYAHFAEFGTVHETPKPVLRKAFDEEKGFALQALIEKLEEGITKASL